MFTRYEVISMLNKKITQQLTALLRHSCFGHFFDIDETNFQFQLICRLFLMEVIKSNMDQLRFKLSVRQ